MSKFGFDKIAQKLREDTKLASIEMMRATKDYWAQAFEKEQLGDEKWAEVERRKPGSPYNAGRIVTGVNKPSGKRFVADQGDDFATRKILHGTTGRLLYKTVKADSSITNYGAVSTFRNPVPYSGFVNEGTPYMPARPFMKHTDDLTAIHLTILGRVTGVKWQKV